MYALVFSLLWNYYSNLFYLRMAILREWNNLMLANYIEITFNTSHSLQQKSWKTYCQYSTHIREKQLLIKMQGKMILIYLFQDINLSQHLLQVNGWELSPVMFPEYIHRRGAETDRIIMSEILSISSSLKWARPHLQ